MTKRYLTAAALLEDAFELALRVIESGYRPDLLVGVWRGGAPVGVAVQEVFDFAGLPCEHLPVRTSSYSGQQQHTQVRLYGLELLPRHLRADQRLLLVDDVFDSGLSMQALIGGIEALYPAGAPEIRVAVPWYKPAHNRSTRVPDYFLHCTEDWLVFPHELDGLSDVEIAEDKPGVDSVKTRLLRLRAGGWLDN